MFKVRTVSLGRVLTCSTAVLYLGYLWYKRKRTLSHRQSDKKRPRSESSELIDIDDQELLKALEEASRSLEVSQIVEEKLVENSVVEEVMEPTLSQVEIKEVESFVNNTELNKSDTEVTMSNENQVCLESISKITSTVESLTEDLNNLKLSEEKDSKIEVENLNTVENSFNVEHVKENINEECTKEEKTSWTEMVEENEDHCECPKAVVVKKVKKDEEPMIFEGIKFKGKKKKGRKKNQARDIIKLPTESHSKNSVNNISVKPLKKNPVVEEDCDSAHSIDHSIDTNDAPNTIYSDIRSEGSQDSGKGGSSYSGELRTVSDSDEQTSYDFLVPIDLVGPIIGKKGAFVKYIKEKSNVRLFVENKTESPEDKVKMCTLVGSESNINKALKLIRIKFPERAYPEFTLECITPMLMDGSPVISQLFKSELIEGVNNHVIVTDVIATDHFFVHNASSPDYALLSSLNFAMNDTFGNSKEDIPEVDLRTVTHGSVVATYSEGNWYRAQVIDVDEKKYESANVFFLDYGGCKKIEQCDMRPMHDSLISLSFQAIECSLANIAPTYGEWCEESLKTFEALTTGKMLFAQVVYKSDSVQYVNLLAFDGLVTLSVNDELIKYGFAVYVPNGIYRNEVIQATEHEPTSTPA